MQELVNVMTEIRDLLKDISGSLGEINRKIDSSSIEIINKMECAGSDVYNQLINIENAVANVQGTLSNDANI